LDELLSSKAFPATTEFSTEIIQAQLSEDLSDSALSNYNIALRKYEQYLDWQGKH
ncbi:flagellar regulatory protein FliZ, partial [Morganella morganii]